MRLKLTIAYNGVPYSGWQSQPSGNTVQDIIQGAISKISKSEQPHPIHGSGRTDTGVHADAQIAHFDTPKNVDMNPYNWVPAINNKLPLGIRIIDCEEVPNDFHARFSAKQKTYVYELCLAPVLHPHLHGRVWHLPRQLDPESLEIALSHYLGTHCFKAFVANRGNETEATEYTRTIYQSEFETIDNGYRIIFTGDGFMYKMVRLLTGTAVQVSQGRIRLDDHLALLDQPAELPNGKAPYCAPASGLTLLKVEY